MKIKVSNARQKTCKNCGAQMFIMGYLSQYQYKLDLKKHRVYFCSGKCLEEYKKQINFRDYRKL